MKTLLQLLFALALALGTARLHAQPVQLSESAFEHATTGLPRVIENFDAMPLGLTTSPLQLANGRYYGNPTIMNGLWCVQSPCLATGISNAEFTDFPANSAYWSGRIIYASSGDDVPEATVVGNGGTQLFVLPVGVWEPSGVFVGFHDPAGLRSVSFRLIQGGINYSIDDVRIASQTAGPAARSVPAQSPASALTLTMLMLALGLLYLGRSNASRPI